MLPYVAGAGGLAPAGPGLHPPANGGSVFPGGALKSDPRLLRRGPVRRHEVPVDELVEKRLRVDGTQVLVVEVVGVLPHVHDKQRGHTRRRRHLGVGSAHDLEVAVSAAAGRGSWPTTATSR